MTQASSSVAMEVQGFKTGLLKLLEQGVQIDCVITDRSVSVRKTMADDFPNIPHEFDTWHTSKGICYDNALLPLLLVKINNVV